MTWCYSRKLCLVSLWISALQASGHGQQFVTTSGAHELSSSTILTIIFSVLGPILGIIIVIACFVFCYCANADQKRTLSYGTPFSQGINSTTGWQHTTARSNNQDNRQTVQGTR